MTPLASLSFIVPLKARDAGRVGRVRGKDKRRMATTTNWCATAESNKPRTGSPWLTSGKVSGGDADSACISLMSETSMGFSTSSGGGFILQFLGPGKASKQRLRDTNSSPIRLD